jgi:hypothetical protein
MTTAPEKAAPPAWGGSGAPGQKPQVIPGQGPVIKGDPGSAIVSGYRQPPPVAPQPAPGGGDNLLRSGFGGGDRGFSRSPLGQQQMAMWGIAPYPA